jgi:hypothetical protein
MNKGISIALLIGMIVGTGLWLSSRPESTETSESSSVTPITKLTQPDSKESTTTEVANNNNNSNVTTPKLPENYDGHEDIAPEVKPANEVYQNAAAALEAVKNGALQYDDIILEQFVGLKDCSWCPEFFTGVKELMLADSSSSDLKSYSAEILALSGSVENVGSLFEALEKSQNPDNATIYAEALELAYGDDQLVSYLTGKLDSENKVVKEASLAALTNHGSPTAVDAIYKATVASNDQSGFYDQGLGLGEMIPDEAAIPTITDLAKKNDQYSHLAVKALLNYGTDGLKIVDSIINDLDEPSVAKMLENAVDHVAFEDDVKAIATQGAAKAKTDSARNFWNAILEEVKLSEDEETLADAEDEEEQ